MRDTGYNNNWKASKLIFFLDSFVYFSYQEEKYKPARLKGEKSINVPMMNLGINIYENTC
jgi:hypothetical protein